MTAFQSWFRRRCSRLVCIHLLVLSILGTIWWYSQALPVALSYFRSDELFYGTVHRASQSPLFGRVSFRINDDDGAEFQLWMDKANRAEFDKWFAPNIPLQIYARRSLGHDWLVIALDSPYGGLDFAALAQWRIRMGLMSLVLGSVALFGFLWLWREYRAYFRFRPWWSLKG